MYIVGGTQAKYLMEHFSEFFVFFLVMRISALASII